MATSERQRDPTASEVHPGGASGEDGFWADRPLGEEPRLRDLAEEPEEGGAPWFAVVAIVLAVGLGLLVVTTGLGAETPFYTVDQAVAAGAVEPGERLRLKGIVEPGSVVGSPGSIERSFRIAEKGESVPVHYAKALPDTFQEGMEVVTEGTIGDDGAMAADEVLVKCPSRYEGQAPTAEGGAQASPEGPGAAQGASD